MKVTEVIDPAFKTGTSAKGTLWVMAKIRTDENTEGTIFGQIRVGDEIKGNYNDQYKNWNFEKVTEAKKAQWANDEKIDEILKIVKELRGTEVTTGPKPSDLESTYNSNRLEPEKEEYPF